jgi:hypothetical protein
MKVSGANDESRMTIIMVLECPDRPGRVGTSFLFGGEADGDESFHNREERRRRVGDYK